MDAATWLRSLEDPNANADKKAKVAEIAAFVSAQKNLDDALCETPMRVATLLNAERALLYVADAQANHLYALAKSGAVIKEVRATREPTNIPGLVATTSTSVNVRDPYDANELGKLSGRLKFDGRVDKALGFRTKSVMAVPVLHEEGVVGVLQIANRKDDQPFAAKDLAYAEEIAKAIGASLGALLKTQNESGTRTAGRWDRLLTTGAVTKDALTKALADASANQMDTARWLIEKVGVGRNEVEASLTAYYGVPFFRFTGKESILPELKPRLRVDFLKKVCAVPVERRGPNLVVVIDDPTDINRTDQLRSIDPDRQLLIHAGFRDEILACIEFSYGMRGDVGLILKELSSDESTGAIDEIDDEGRGDDPDSAVIKLANQIIIDAFQRGASDIHIEPNGKEANTVVRFRIDGECVLYQDIPPAVRNSLVARIKIMSKLDISERRKPQDGKIKFRMKDRQIELRVATLPTVNGNEDVVMRILAASKPLPLEDMGMSPRNLRELKILMAKPYGLMLCVGPTGSGKTTTLHSALGSINTVDMKIWTAEDPVEITQPGLRQVQVQPKIGFDFATAMRAFLRADPDVIMVGEMRDKETAGTGIEASLTGHLVLSTLHTNSAPETITRLLDMELDPFSFADALLGVLAQRLARGICKKCRQEYTADEAETRTIIEAFGEEGAAARGYDYGKVRLWRGVGCEACGKTGYKSRVAVHELLVNTDEIKQTIVRRKPVDEIRQLAIAGGMTTLLQDGIEKAIAGKTDLKQVLAVCSR